MFNKRPNKIEYEELKEFCERRIPESSIIDYKRTLEKNPAKKIVSAMANAYGGWIIVGVD